MKILLVLAATLALGAYSTPTPTTPPTTTTRLVVPDTFRLKETRQLEVGNGTLSRQTRSTNETEVPRVLPNLDRNERSSRRLQNSNNAQKNRDGHLLRQNALPNLDRRSTKDDHHWLRQNVRGKASSSSTTNMLTRSMREAKKYGNRSNKNEILLRSMREAKAKVMDIYTRAGRDTQGISEHPLPDRWKRNTKQDQDNTLPEIAIRVTLENMIRSYFTDPETRDMLKRAIRDVKDSSSGEPTEIRMKRSLTDLLQPLDYFLIRQTRDEEATAEPETHNRVKRYAVIKQEPSYPKGLGEKTKPEGRISKRDVYYDDEPAVTEIVDRIITVNGKTELESNNKMVDTTTEGRTFVTDPAFIKFQEESDNCPNQRCVFELLRNWVHDYRARGGFRTRREAEPEVEDLVRPEDLIRVGREAEAEPEGFAEPEGYAEPEGFVRVAREAEAEPEGIAEPEGFDRVARETAEDSVAPEDAFAIASVISDAQQAVMEYNDFRNSNQTVADWPEE